MVTKLIATLLASLLGLGLAWAGFPSSGQYSGTISPPPSPGCISSTGGSITVVGGNRIHTFTSSGTFTAGGTCTINYLIVGGGGGGGSGGSGSGFAFGGGGGGCGGVLSSSFAITAGARTVTVGGAGAGNGGSGGSSTISGITTANGGGAGGTGNGGNGVGGGCGGGGAGSSNIAGVGGTPTLGGGGGSGLAAVVGGGGGGGGMAAAGSAASTNGVAGAGSSGIASAITGTSHVYGCGGGGGGASGGAAGCAGAGAGGTGVAGAPGGNASFYGDGGGGGYQTGGGAGFGGIVVISYPNVAPPVVNAQTCTALSPVTVGQFICTFTASGSPTAWQLVSQTCAGCYAINNLGVVSGGLSATNVNSSNTMTVTASNVGGVGLPQTNVINASNSNLPLGVTLQAIDGESLSGLSMTHNYYGRNGFTRVTAGTFNPSWDNPAFYPIMSFYLESLALPRAVDLGYNVGIDDVEGSVTWSNYDTYKMWTFSAFPGAGGPPNPASDFIPGTYTDEPQNLNTDNSGGSPLYLNNSVAGTTIARGPVLIAQTSNSAATGQFGSDGSGPPMTATTNPATAWVTANPGSQSRGVDMTNMDFYWFADSTDNANSRAFSCARMVYHGPGPDCTTDQMARCSGYGGNISEMRNEYFGNGNEPETVPATTPLGIYVEEGNGNQTGGPRQITPGELICAAWDSIIHGARFLSYFYWYDMNNLATNDPIYVAVKSTNTLITAQAPMLNSPFAVNYVSVSLSDGNANSYIFPNWSTTCNPSPGTCNNFFGGGLDIAAKWYSNKFYLLVTTKYGESAYTTKTATFTVAGGGSTATVVYSSDSALPSPIPITSGHFSDTFPHPWSVRIYQINP